MVQTWNYSDLLMVYDWVAALPWERRRLPASTGWDMRRLPALPWDMLRLLASEGWDTISATVWCLDERQTIIFFSFFYSPLKPMVFKLFVQ